MARRGRTALVFLALAACGRVRDHAPADGLRTDADSGASAPFECTSLGGVSLRRAFQYRPDEGPLWPVYDFSAAGEDVLVSTRHGLVHLSRDGIVEHRVPAGDATEVRGLNPLATSALIRQDGTVSHVAANGNVIATLGPTAMPSASGIMRARFSESGTALVLELGRIDLEHEHTDAMEIRSPDGTLIHRFEGAREALVGDDDHLVVTAADTEVIATSDQGTELWRAPYRTVVNLLWGSRNARTVFVHSDSLTFLPGADNSGLLVVDGNAISVPYLVPVGFSPDGTRVASGQFGTLTMRENGGVTWEAVLAPELFVDSVSVNTRGQTMISGTLRYTDGGAKRLGFAFLYDADGVPLARCSSSEPTGGLYSAFSFEGTSFGVYGAFGLVSYAIE